MDSSIVLNNNNIDKIPDVTGRPLYNRDAIKAGIVHIGVGGFHRAHQAYYLDELINNHGINNWAVCGIGLREEDRSMQRVLKKQDCLYTLMVRYPDGNTKTRVIGSIIDYIIASDDAQVAINKIAHHDTKIVSLTITEGGYNYNPNTGEFIYDNPDIQWDLKNIDQPKTVFGYLAAALYKRKNNDKSPLTIVSCDNIQRNGDVTRKMLLAFTEKFDRKLSQWIKSNVSFPNSMIDRITPVTEEKHIEELRKIANIKDAWPVVCESFHQWIIEDVFCNERPGLEKVGVQFVEDVDPYEKIKIRLLNAGHSLLGIIGTLNNYVTIDQVIQDECIKTILCDYMDYEVTPILEKVKEIDIEEYKKTLIQRFENPFIKDKLNRICSESSAKIPQFVLPTITEQLRRNGSIKRGTAIIASWCYYLEMADNPDANYEVNDALSKDLKRIAKESISNPITFIEYEPIFGDLASSKRFRECYIKIINGLRINGSREMIKSLIAKN